MKLRIKPEGEDRVLEVEHPGWGLTWHLQFPETVTTAEGEFMAWPANCRPLWEDLGNGGWGYTWRPWEGYAESVRKMGNLDASGNPQHERFVQGMSLRAEVHPEEEVLCLSLTLVNEGPETYRNVHCDGGCWQARNDAFAGEVEVARSFVGVGKRMVSMKELPRTVPERCMYHHDLSRYEPRHEWFWGTSRCAVDRPAVVGMQSRDGTRAVIFGYEQADSALANSDAHHCLHSRPVFGTITPAQSVRRRGFILFGSDLHQLAGQLDTRLNGSDTDQ